MQHTQPNYHDVSPLASHFEPLDEFGFDVAEDEFLDRHLAAIRESLNDFRNQ